MPLSWWAFTDESGAVDHDGDARGVVGDGGENGVEAAEGGRDHPDGVDAHGEGVVLADDAQSRAAEFDGG